MNIRPKYQREFVYDPDKRDAVLDTIRKGFPLNVMYWMRNADAVRNAGRDSSARSALPVRQ